MAEVSTLNSIPAADIATVNSVPVANIASINGIDWPAVGDGEFYNDVIANSCMFEYNTSSSIGLQYGSPSADRRIFTVSLWFKRSNLGLLNERLFDAYNNVDNRFSIYFLADNTIEIANNLAGEVVLQLKTTAKFLDCSGWYHSVFAYDSTQGVPADRNKLWINGVQITAFDTENNADLDDVTNVGSAVWHFVGRYGADSVRHFSGYLADFYLVDDQALEATDFGEFKNGIWIPKSFGGTLDGLNTVHLDFAIDNDLGNDVSGKNNDWTVFNMGTDHQVTDTPENNFCTLDTNTQHPLLVMTEGALKYGYSPAVWLSTLGTFLMTAGKWYWEVDIGSDLAYSIAGVCAAGERSGDLITSGHWIGQDQYSAGLKLSTPNYVLGVSGITTNDDNLDAPANGDIMTVAFDADTGKIWFGMKNAGSGHIWGDFGPTGVGDPANGTNPAHTFLKPGLFDFVPAFSAYEHLTSYVNFGQRTFSGTQPTGFKSLCTENLPEPAVIEPGAEAVNVVLYEGTGAEHAITGVGFQPDFVWIKNRDQADSHCLYDSVRGATKTLHPDAEVNESTDVQHLQSFDADGFTLGTADEVNTNAEKFVALCLKKGAEYGLDIVSYPGTGDWQSIEHGLGVVPEMFIVKERADDNSQWAVFHYAALNKTDPETDWGRLDSVAAWTDNVNVFHDTKPTTTHFTVGVSGDLSGVGDTYIAYLFASIPGFSKVFHYEANGNVNGPYIYCGFKPRWFFWKNADLGSSNWVLTDSERSPYNGPNIKTVLPSAPNAEGTALSIDYMSNGFKIRTVSTGTNQNNHTIVGVAFAEQPFKYGNAR